MGKGVVLMMVPKCPNPVIETSWPDKRTEEPKGGSRGKKMRASERNTLEVEGEKGSKIATERQERKQTKTT